MTLDVKARPDVDALRALLNEWQPSEHSDLTDAFVYLGTKRYRGPDIATILAALPALLDRLERAEAKAAAGLSLRQTMWLGAGTERSRTCPAVALRLYDSTLAALDDEAPR